MGAGHFVRAACPIFGRTARAESGYKSHYMWGDAKLTWFQVSENDIGFEISGEARNLTRCARQGAVYIEIRRKSGYTMTDWGGNPDCILKLRGEYEVGAGVTSRGALRGIDLNVKIDDAQSKVSWVNAIYATAELDQDINITVDTAKTAHLIMKNNGVVETAQYTLELQEISTGTVPTDTVVCYIHDATNGPASGEVAAGLKISATNTFTCGIVLTGDLTDAINIDIDDSRIRFGDGQDASIQWKTTGFTQDALVIGLGASRALVLMDEADVATTTDVFDTALSNPGIVFVPETLAAGNYCFIRGSKVGSRCYMILKTSGTISHFLFQAEDDADDSDYLQVKIEDAKAARIFMKGTDYVGFANLGTAADNKNVFVFTGASEPTFVSGGLPSQLQVGGDGSGIVLVSDDTLNHGVLIYYDASAAKVYFKDTQDKTGEVSLS